MMDPRLDEANNALLTDPTEEQTRQVTRRQAAASYLRAARAAQDEAERAVLRHKAANLLSPHLPDRRPGLRPVLPTPAGACTQACGS
jgi:hypothetical protein